VVLGTSSSSYLPTLEEWVVCALVSGLIGVLGGGV